MAVSDVEVARSIVKEMTPANLTVAQFITFLSIILGLFLITTKIELVKFDDATLQLINNIWSFKNVLCIFVITSLIKISDFILWELKFKNNYAYGVIEWRIFTRKVCNLCSAVISSYLLLLILEKNSLQNLNYEKWNYIIFSVYLLCILIHFVILLKEIFKEDEESLEYAMNRRKYLDRTMKKYKALSLEDMQKRVALFTIYNESKEKYDYGIRLDEDEFRKEDYYTEQQKEMQRRQEEVQRQMSDYFESKKR